MKKSFGFFAVLCIVLMMFVSCAGGPDALKPATVQTPKGTFKLDAKKFDSEIVSIQIGKLMLDSRLLGNYVYDSVDAFLEDWEFDEAQAKQELVDEDFITDNWMAGQALLYFKGVLAFREEGVIYYCVDAGANSGACSKMTITFKNGKTISGLWVPFFHG